MSLLINSHSKSIFFSCVETSPTRGSRDGWAEIIILHVATPPQVVDEEKKGNGRLLGMGVVQLVAWLGGPYESGGENNG